MAADAETRDEQITRRGLLRRLTRIGAVGAGAAAFTSLAGQPAFAGTDGDVALGVDNQPTGSSTGVQSNGITGFHGRSTREGGTGLFGEAFNLDGMGVHGVGDAEGVVGEGKTGVYGSGLDRGVSGAADAGGTGISGSSSGTGSRGVYGQAEYGVEGYATITGLYGTGQVTGAFAQGKLIGVHAVSMQPGGTGVGLRVDGRSVFRTAGVATIASGKTQVTVALAGVTTADVVLATVQGTGSFYVRGAKAGSGQFTIRISAAPPSPQTVKVAWFVLSFS